MQIRVGRIVRHVSCLTVTLDNLCEGDSTISCTVLAENADADATLRVEDAYDVATTGKRSAPHAHCFGADSRNVGVGPLLGCDGRLHVLRIGERHDHLCISAPWPSAPTERAWNGWPGRSGSDHNPRRHGDLGRAEKRTRPLTRSLLFGGNN